MTALAKSQAHEQAFRRWSVPAAEEVAPTESGVSEIAPPSSFRVYSPEETRLAPLRPAHRPSTRGVTDELASSLSLAA